MNKYKLIEIQKKVQDLYGAVVRCKYGEFSEIGVVILDPEKMSNKLYEIMNLLDDFVGETKNLTKKEGEEN